MNLPGDLDPLRRCFGRHAHEPMVLDGKNFVNVRNDIEICSEPTKINIGSRMEWHVCNDLGITLVLVRLKTGMPPPSCVRNGFGFGARELICCAECRGILRCVVGKHGRPHRSRSVVPLDAVRNDIGFNVPWPRPRMWCDQKRNFFARHPKFIHRKPRLTPH